MVKIVEVGARDGLQNEAATIPTATKIAFVNALSEAGVNEVEASAFVSPRSVPQLQDAEQVFRTIHRDKRVVYSALVPNAKGLDRAIAAKVDKISIFTAASETFNRNNINTSIEGSIKRYAPLVQRAVQIGLPVRGYLSTAFWCAFEGRIAPRSVVDLTKRLIDLGVREVSISDTIGKATPAQVAQLFDMLLPDVSTEQIAVHFHDTYGNGVANVLQSVSYGIRTIDASVGGLGGCPFAPGATGNVATEDVVHALRGQGMPIAVDTEILKQARQLLVPYLGSQPRKTAQDDASPCSECSLMSGEGCCLP